MALHAGVVRAGSTQARRPVWSTPGDAPSRLKALERAGARTAWVHADTDTVATDTLLVGADSTGLAADSTGALADSTRRAETYFPSALIPGAAGGYSVSLVQPDRPGLRGRLGTYWQRRTVLDSTAYRYTISEAVGEADVRAPADLPLAQYLEAQRQAALVNGFRGLAAQRTGATRRRAGVGFTVDIPGGEQSAFRTLFGRNEVDLTVSGRSNVDLGVNYNSNELQSALTGRGGSINPDFGQELNLNVAGTIGDKLRINVNYDTQNDFQFENQVSLVYTGYEDDIVQRIEAGNVFLQTPSELIRGGQRLFGIRTDLQFGPLGVTAVASQQDAETSEVTIEGGSQTTPFSLAPYEYEDNAHFFLGYFFHNWWDSAHRQPGLRSLPPGVREIVGIEVWKFDQRLTTAQTDGSEITYAVALADLAEPGGITPDRQPLGVLRGGEEYLASFGDPGQTPAPDSTLDQYDEADLARIRANTTVIDYNQEFGLGSGGAANTLFRRLTAGIDYEIDAQLGTLSLTTPLSERDIVAVAYQYRTTDGRIVTVGDFGRSAQNRTLNGPRSVLKLIRADIPTPAAPLWDLTMRNIYRIGGRSLNPSAFDLGITYESPGSTALELLPDVTFGDQQTLLQVLGLDRVNAQGSPPPDDAFDFQVGLTIDPSNGRVIFPVRQPFGDFLQRLILEGRSVSGETVNVVTVNGPQGASDFYAYPALYDVSKSEATRLNGLSRYRIAGEFRSAAQSVFNVGFNIVPGTVTVTSGGRPLTEGTDFRVNAAQGTVEIINPLYLQNGQQVRVQVEQNRLFAVGSKTLLGLRADYRFSEDAGLGLTWMRLAERPLVDKFRIGEEALQNEIFGIDGRYLAEPRWITRVLDRLPLIQTRAPSRFEIRGEVARLNPGHPQTLAFTRTERRLSNEGLVLPEDEQAGLSYVDDFEGSENAFTALGETGGWRIIATPDSAGPNLGTFPTDAPVTDVRRPTNWRGLFAWYSLSRSSYEAFTPIQTQASRQINVLDLYPDRPAPASGERNPPLTLLDLYFDPTRRGPYNYNGDLGGTFEANPMDVWGGMIRPIDGTYSDFEGQNNVEFVELLVSPLGGRAGDEPIGPDARLYIDLGQLNEDILPNGNTNSEDGIPDTDAAPAALDLWGRLPLGQASGAVDYFQETGRTEDLGLDGLPSRTTDVGEGGQPYALDEATFFAPFLQALPSGPEQNRASRDPSGDDYHHFREDTYFADETLFPGGASVQERFAHYLPGYELNSIQAYAAIVRSGEAGISNQPNSEDINGDIRATSTEAYHRYTLPLDAAGLSSSPFLQNTIDVSGQTFYLIRIPVRTSLRETSGLEREDFSRIESIRIWTSGHDRPATLRIASFKLVGSQWLKSEVVGGPDDLAGVDPEIAAATPAPELFIASINSEDSPTTYAIPRLAIQNTSRTNAGSINDNPREQALVFRTEGLAETRTAGIVRTYGTRPYDMTRYTNLRMFVHGHGFEQSDSVYVVIRLGDDETQNYYEYEQPLYPFDPDEAALLDKKPRSDSLWQTNVLLGDGTTVDRNSVNILLSELNRLKVARDQAGVALSDRYVGSGTPEGAPEGARIAIVGQPSINDVRTIVLGVRNRDGGQVVPLDTVEVWFNELRVSGYDESGGTSGFVTTTLALADVATLNARISFTQDGFGDLGGGLGDREFSDRSAYSFSSNISAHKLLPERFGWQIPVTFSVTQTGATPRFDPERGDIRLDELVANVLEDSSATALPVADRQLEADRLVERAQTVSGSRNFRVQASKTGSRSPWLRYTLDGLLASYTSNAVTGRNPANRSNTTDSWSGNLNYRLNVPRPKTVRPLWFTGPVPVLGDVLGGLRLNVLPQSLTLSTSLNRNVAVVQPRATSVFASDPDSVLAFRTRTRTTQTFTHGRTMDLAYNPFSFLRLSYGSTTDQDLGRAGQVEANRVLVYVPETDSTDAFVRSYSLTPAEARSDTSMVRSDLRALFGELVPATGTLPGFVQVLGGATLDVLPFGEAISNVFTDQNVRTRGYTQNLQATATVSTRRVRWLSWIRPQALSYRTTYTWNDVPLPSADPDLRVAGARAQVQLQSGLQLAPREFWRLFPFYRRMETAAGRGQSAGRSPAGRPSGVPGRPAAGQAAGGQAPTGQTAASDSTATRRGFNPATLGRQLFLAVTGVSDVTLTYRGSFASTTDGLLGGSYSLLGGVLGDAPPPAFRLGLRRRIPIDQRLSDAELQLPLEDRLSDQHTLEGRTSLEPFPSLRIGLLAQTNWDRSTRTPYSFAEVNGSRVLQELTQDRRGTGTSTVLALGSSYQGFIDRHVQRFGRDAGGNVDGDGRYTSEFLLRNGQAEDFQREFGRGLGRFGAGGFFAIPVPGWDVTFSGLSKWPLFRRLAQQVTIRHNYSATSQTAYSSFFSTDRRVQTIQTPGDPVVLVEPERGGEAVDEATTLTVNESFQPLVGLQVTWKGGIQTSVNYEQSHLYTLQTQGAQLTEKSIRNVRVELSYAKTGLRLFGLRRLNNNLTFNLVGSLFDDLTLNRPFGADVLSTLVGQDIAADSEIRTRRYSLAPRLGYTISNQVTASLFVEYTRSEPIGTQAAPTTDFDGGVSLRILFSN